jgi:hypothetical protein
MALHARRKGTNAALNYFPCFAWSLIEDLPKASFCFIAISFFIILRCCLYSMNFFSLIYRTESIPNLYSIAQCTEFPFQQVFYLPKSDSGQESYVRFTSVMKSVLNFRTRNAQCFLYNSLHGSSNPLVLDVLERQLYGASEYLIFSIFTPLNKLSNWWRQQHPLRDLERLMIYLATL